MIREYRTQWEGENNRNDKNHEEGECVWNTEASAGQKKLALNIQAMVPRELTLSPTAYHNSSQSFCH